MRSSPAALLLGALALPAACSLLAPPDSELVRTRPDGMSGSSGASTGGTELGSSGAPTSESGSGGTVGAEGGAGGVDDGVDEEGVNAPGKPVDVGVPTGDWEAGPGLKTRWATEVGPAGPHGDYPRPDLTRHDWATLNGLWEFAINSSDTTVPAFDGTQLLVPFPLESQLSGIAGGALGDDEYLWYRRTFQMPAIWRDRRLLLHFGAVDWDCSVRINGTEVVTHRGGYDGFSVDITDQLAAEDAQEIVVRVADPTDSGTQPRGKQALVPSTGTSLSAVSGIWQSVWLEPVPTISIQDVEISGDPTTGAVTLTSELSAMPAGTKLRAMVFDETRTELVRAEADDGAALELTVPSPQAWTPDSPYRYFVTLELEQGGVVVDSADSYFGLRTLAVGQDGGVTKLMLNGAPFLSMAVLSQGYWPDGLYTPPNDVALKAELTLVKNFGFNSIRVNEKIESERFYYWADRLGLLVWQDMPAGDNSSAPARDVFSAELAAVVAERKSHVSLGLWTLFPSSVGLTGADVGGLVDQLTTLTSNQLVIGASGPGDDGAGDLRDRPDASAVTSPVPDERAVVLGQYGSFSRAITGHTWSGNTGAVQTATDTARYAGLARRVRGLGQRPGLSGAAYRQLTDVENELDGLVTYDRALTKVTAKAAEDANTDASTPVVPLIQASEFELRAQYASEAQRFRYVTSAPAAQWLDQVFNDAGWTEVPAGIGDTADAGARIRTRLAFGEIWARTTFTLDEKPSGTLIVRLMHDEDTQVFVNGVRAVDTYTWVTSYRDFLGSAGAVEALVAGENSIAVHTFNSNGGRYVDVGLWLSDDPPSYRAPDEPASTAAGLDYADYDLALDSLPADLSVNTARQTGTASSVGTYAPALASDTTRAIRLHGYVEVVQAGVFTFFVDTDDGARLSIGTDRVAEALRNDGTGVTKRAGNIALAAGKHEITIQYFANDNQGANSFGVTWSGPGFAEQDIAAGNLSH